MKTLHIRTPLIQSHTLSSFLGKEVFLKLEALQPSGSFKLRGIGNLCMHYTKQGKTKFISSSGGNAGLAVAYAGRKLKIAVDVIVPESTPIFVQEKLRLEGARVSVSGASWIEADALARKLAESPEAAYIPPFDHP